MKLWGEWCVGDHGKIPMTVTVQFFCNKGYYRSGGASSPTSSTCQDKGKWSKEAHPGSACPYAHGYSVATLRFCFHPPLIANKAPRPLYVHILWDALLSLPGGGRGGGSGWWWYLCVFVCVCGGGTDKVRGSEQQRASHPLSFLLTSTHIRVLLSSQGMVVYCT